MSFLTSAIMHYVHSFLQPFLLATLAVAAPLIGSSLSQNTKPKGLELPLNTNATTLTIALFNATNADVICSENQRGIDPSGCIEAISNLPINAGPTEFGTFTQLISNRLPQSQVSTTFGCEAFVELVDPRQTVQSSWADIRRELERILTTCAPGVGPYLGGTNTVGTGGGIRVTLENPFGPGAGDVGNAISNIAPSIASTMGGLQGLDVLDQGSADSAVTAHSTVTNSTDSALLASHISSSLNEFRCYPTAPYRALKPLECTNAMRKFPHGTEIETFSRTSTDKRYRLPQPQIDGNCWIQVDAAILPEDTSWNKIRDAMSYVYTSCVTGGRWHGGGEISFGDFNGLTVSIRNTVAPGLGSDASGVGTS